MAVSDPTMSVPTPTGVLQGVAAFNWDGAVWQPGGRAGPSVPTPTGNLQGVAAFSGTPPQPSGRAGPGVATPTGVLDGVAVYTWSGAQWTPPGGSPTPSAPSGALRGVAAFDWDGAAWQPAGQAGPDVPTPYGVLQGVARFGWTGTAWAAVGAPSLSLDFMAPGTLDPRITFTRASTATYTDASGTIQTAATNAPRWDYDPVTHALRGLLIEEARTNLLTRSIPLGGSWANLSATTTGAAGTAPDGTNTLVQLAEDTSSGFHMTYSPVTISASSTNLFSVYAKASQVRYLQLTVDDAGSNGVFTTFDLQAGAISGAPTTFGAAVAGAASIQLVGNGIYRCSMTANVGAATGARTLLALSNLGNPPLFPQYVGNSTNGLFIWGAQVEQGAFPTSYISTTTAAVTRAQDIARVPSASMGWFTAPGGSWVAEFIMLTSPLAGINPRVVSIPTAAGVAPITTQNTRGAQFDGSGLFTGNSVSVGAITKIGSTYTSGTGTVCMNGGTIASLAMTTGYAGLVASGLAFFVVAAAGSTDNGSGCLRSVRYWPRVLSNVELQQVTT
jgi:hypothetical protein